MEKELILNSNKITTESIGIAEEKKRFTVMGVEFCYLYVIGIGFALLGWVAENTVRIITKGIIDCRFHLLPFISPYALVPFAFQLVLGDPDNITIFGHKVFKRETLKTKVLSNILCIVLILGGVFLGELAIGNLWELLFGVQLWNYSAFPLHITQYAGLIPTLGYGGGAYLLFRFVYKPLLRAVRKMKYGVAKGICLSLGILILLDTLAMAIQIAILHEPPMYWSIKLW